jgi:hypothetical protein
MVIYSWIVLENILNLHDLGMGTLVKLQVVKIKKSKIPLVNTHIFLSHKRTSLH